MRLMLGLLLLLTFSMVNGQTTSPVTDADVLLQAAYEKAATENKQVLVIFQASWCGWCRKMDASLQDPAVKPLMEKSYEIVHLTVYESPNKKQLENPGALAFLTKLGGADKGLPYWYILDKNGKLLFDSQYAPGKNTGCPASEEEVAYFINVLKQTSAMTEVEYEQVRSRFRKNDN